MYVEDKYAIYHYAKTSLKDNEFRYFYKDSIKRDYVFCINISNLQYVDLDLLDSKDTILHMMYSDNTIDQQLAYEILKTNGCITERKQNK
jgi:hypothetical protein